MREHVSTEFIFYQWTFCNVPMLRENEEIMDFWEEKKGRNTDCFFYSNSVQGCIYQNRIKSKTIPKSTVRLQNPTDTFI